MSNLIVTLLGPARVFQTTGPYRSNGLHTVPAARPPRKVTDLLAYLLLGGRRTYQRDELADHFWGDQDMDRARRSLSTAVWRLRKVLERGGVPHGTYLSCLGGEALGFNWSSAHHIDVVELEAVLDRSLAMPPERMSRADARSLDAGLDLYTGDLLCGAQDIWALRERERLSARYLDGLSHLMRHKLYTGNYQRGLEIGARILNKDPLREDVHRDMMRLQFRTGQRSRAIRQYHDCSDLLKRELQVEPAEETQSTYREVCRGGIPDGSSTSAVPPVTAEEALCQLQRALEEVDRARALVERLVGRDAAKIRTGLGSPSPH